MSAAPRRLLCTMRWPVGGIRTYVLYSYPRLEADGWRFTFLGPDDPTMDAFRKDVAHFEGVECVGASVSGRSCDLRGAARGLLRSGRFSAAHSQGLTAGAQVAWANRRAGVPHVVTSHDVFPPGRHAGLIGRAKRMVLARLLARADAIVSVTKDARENLLENLPRLARGVRHETIPHGIALPAEPPPPRADLRGSLGLSPDVALVGFLGRFMEQKGFLPLLGAVARLQAAPPERPFCLVAVGSGDFEPQYRREVDRRGLASSVRFLPFVADAGPVVRAVDLVAMPSLWEAAGLLAMETLVSGTPLLASDCVGLREVVRGTPARTAPPGDEAAWAEALRLALAADAPLAREARAFVPEARARFDVARPAARLSALLADVSGPGLCLESVRREPE